MADRAAVLQLARLIGVDTHYTDALGETRQVSDDTLSALITGFGLPADPVSARRQLEDQYRELPLGLEAAQIVGAEDPQPELGLRLPVKCRKIVWTCRLEDGGECHGHAVLDGGARKGRLMMPLPAGLPLGYHRLEVEAGNISADINLIVAPDRCYLPAELGTGARSWGLSCQLYGLCSERNWGIGDFGDLATLARGAGRHGAAVVGINPLHALFAAEPEPARLSLHRRDGRTRLCRGRGDAQPDAARVVRRDPLGRPLGSAHRLRRGRSMQTAGVGGPVWPLPVA